MTNRRRLRWLCGLTALWGVLAASCAWAGCEGVPEACREDLIRIDRAYRSGLREASDAGERFEVERLRVAALAELTERTYESSLAWVAEHEDSTGKFEREQGLWLTSFHAALEKATTDDAMRAVAEMLRGRLRVFGALTRDAYCVGEGCH